MLSVETAPGLRRSRRPAASPRRRNILWRRCERALDSLACRTASRLSRLQVDPRRLTALTVVSVTCGLTLATHALPVALATEREVTLTHPAVAERSSSQVERALERHDAVRRAISERERAAHVRASLPSALPDDKVAVLDAADATLAALLAEVRPVAVSTPDAVIALDSLSPGVSRHPSWSVVTDEDAVVHMLGVAADDQGTVSILAAVKVLADATTDIQVAAAELVAQSQDVSVLAVEEAIRQERVDAEVARKVTAVMSAPNGQVSTSDLCGLSFAPGQLLRCDAAAALERLNAFHVSECGSALGITDSYRPLDRQIEVKLRKPELAATPGSSNHGTGQAVDFTGFGAVGQFDDPDYLWMKAHAEEFGWHHPRGMEAGGQGPQEPWHWEYATS